MLSKHFLWFCTKILVLHELTERGMSLSKQFPCLLFEFPAAQLKPNLTQLLAKLEKVYVNSFLEALKTEHLSYIIFTVFFFPFSFFFFFYCNSYLNLRVDKVQEEFLFALTIVGVSHAVTQHRAELPLGFWLLEAIVAVSGKWLPEVHWELPWQLNEGLSSLLLTQPCTEHIPT